MLLTTKLNDTAHKMMWSEAVHTCNHMQKSMATTGSTNIPFEILYGEKPKIIGSFSEFGRITYITKRGNIQVQMKYNTCKDIMVCYAYNNKIYAYKLYNPDIKRAVMTRDINWAELKTIDPAETMKMFLDLNKDDMVPGIEECKTPKSEPEYNLPVHVIPDEV